MTSGQRLRQARETFGVRLARREGRPEEWSTLTQSQLAARSGISRRTIQRIEAGLSEPTKAARLCLASALMVSYRWLWEDAAGTAVEQSARRSAA